MQQPTTLTLSRRTLTARRRAQQGQSIIVALLVLLLLGFLGALFLAIVTSNIQNNQRSNHVQTAGEYAQAGIRFADEQLTNSPDGADWRPPLQYALVNPPTGAYELARYNSNGLSLAPAADPDKQYLDQGFTRYDTGAGRFLIRLTYDPVNTSNQVVPPGRYIKVETIGREGNVDATDPTTYGVTTRLQAYLVAFKPIGITDYALFATNPENRSDIASLGVASMMYDNAAMNYPLPKIATSGVYDFTGTTNAYQPYPIVTTYGSVDAYTTVGGMIYPNPAAGTGSAGAGVYAGGGSIRANMPLRFYGQNILYMYSNSDSPQYQDTMEVAGNMLLNDYDPKAKLDNSTLDGSTTPATGQDAALLLITLANPTGAYVAPSNDPAAGGNGGFSTQGGLIRDGSSQNGVDNLPRSISRLEPPVMDGIDPASSLPRYKAIAMNSPPRTDPSTGSAYIAGSGKFGYGQSIYINNPSDIQTESTTLGNGSTLQDEWLNRTSSPYDATKGGWNGYFYDPPGANITLGNQTAYVNGLTRRFAGIRIAQFGANTWTDPSGAPISGTQLDGTTSGTMTISYDSLNASNPPTATSGNLNNDILIYAEGNVRVHGIVTPTGTIARHITIVTNGTAYIDGNLLKGTPDSSITILAHDYVCVNTTQFLAGPASDQNPDGTAQPNPASVTQPALDFTESGDELVQELSFGITASSVSAAYSAPPSLYVSAGPDQSGSTQADFDIVNPTTGTSINGGGAPFSSLIGSPMVFDTSFGPFTRRSFALTGYPVGALTANDVRQLYIRRDPGANGSTNTSDFLLERAAILPMDIRIEAVLFAQTRSFFVIPGEWFNTDSTDTIDQYHETNGVYDTTKLRPDGDDARFPFHGQPIDLKITIDGAVSEARPADISAQSAWMAKWGWIPHFHGKPDIAGAEIDGHGPPSAGPAIGLQIIYNPQAGYPYDPTSLDYLRSDIYGRPLPFAPKLPVSTALLYAGQSGEAPILQ